MPCPGLSPCPRADATATYEVSQGVAPDPERHADHVLAMNAMLDSIQFGESAAP
jgi:hypothetical protein